MKGAEMNDQRMIEAIGSIWLAIIGALFFSEGYRAISIVTEDGGKCFVFHDQPADRAAFKNALQTAIGEVTTAIGEEAVKYN